ncbi:hypothetical protein IEO70_03285 [Bacillus sp. AGMB 02131]|uniref:Antigen I/II N-terminal domain-containing protein n=1 Tax=Peribacillus faecalis TaxID=2772559 RepID=A0A927HBG5_9BACI|nr:hypothetical protein [Peribacillus faecalis]MBD3107378.1 hypothetical protein [Peribacillus faecalis]
MKKFKIILLLLLALSLAACSSQEDKSESKKEDNESVEVDKGLLNVEVTLPASLFEGQDLDEAIANAKEEGVKEVIKNDDGSVTYIMSKAEHKKLMKEMKEEVIQSIEEMETSEEYPSIQSVDYNKSLNEFTITVTSREEFENSFEGFAIFGIGLQSMYYQLFNGGKSDDITATIHLKDGTTSEVYNTIVYPDDLEEEETETAE